MWDIFKEALKGLVTLIVEAGKEVLSLYASVFKAFPFAAVILIVVLLAAYWTWKYIDRKYKFGPGWLRRFPMLILIGLWLILTPILGQILIWEIPSASPSAEVKAGSIVNATSEKQRP
jgi:hypothetical protein